MSRSLCWALLLSCVLVLGEAKKDMTKDDLRPLSSANGYDIAAMVLLAVGLALASAGGVGGGTMVVPVLILVMGFDIKFATPTSNFIIMGGAVANAIFNLQKRHPYANRPLVDADICMAMIPSMMGGAVVGALLSKLLPSYVISVLLVMLLGVSGYRTMQKGIKLHKKEVATKQKLLEEQAAAPVQDVPQSPLLDQIQATGFQEVRSPAVQVHLDVPGDKPKQALVMDQELEIQALLDAESRFNWKKHGILLVCFLGILAATIGGAESHCGSVAYWVLLIVELPWVFVFTYFFVHRMRKLQEHKRAINFPKVAGDIEWTNKTVVYFPLACTGAGIVAGLFGVGGAIISGPLMLEMGVLPEVASSSSAILVLYSSAAASAKFALFNMIAYDWAGLLCGVAFVVTGVAQVYIGGYVRRTGRQSIIVFCIGITICIGCALMVYSTVRTFIDDVSEPFKVQFCPKSSHSSSDEL